MTPLGKYKGFINREEWMQLSLLLEKIIEVDGLSNQIHHLYQPDTDMNDNVCESLQDSKIFIVNNLNKIKDRIDYFIKRILALN